MRCLPATDAHGDEDEERWCPKAEILLNRSRVHDGGRVDDEGEGGAATFDGKRLK